ncbi:unnamed protein product [Candidula unifasciata]|uniref:BZIP domain-containing protein n=1 Tax=Candidula unifasciata TaxID=100452 RepID=A0A8S3ZLY2_9EUPU|nr:unnamed protein product [Candidula unifasciata]
MASDHDVYNEFVVDGFDLKLNGEIFLTGGMMNPKELYLQDLTLCQDTSSSDSGISAVDDGQDIADITDLNNILDTDFSLDCALLNVEEDSFDADIFFKSEPQSPCRQHELIFPDDGTIKDEWNPLSFPEFLRMDDPLSPASSANSPQQIYTIQQQQSPPEPISPKYEPPSPSLTFNSETLHIDSSAGSDLTEFMYTHILPANNQTGSTRTVYTVESCLSPGAAPNSPPGIVLLPKVKKENQISILPSGGSFVSPNGNIRPAGANIDSILNSKVKIKPKPGSEVIIPTGTTQWVATTANTQLSFSSHHQAFPLISAAPMISAGGILPVTDDKVLKRAQRVIKNRESASLSRKRKKEYLTSLEQRLQQCRDENERLLRENETLKKQLQFLQKENTGLKHTKLSPAKKMCLMCVTFLLVFNFSPFSFMNESTSTSSQPGISQNYHPAGRHLMSLGDRQTDKRYEDKKAVPAYKDMWSASLLMQFDEELSLLAEKLNITGKLGNVCPMYFNTTESNRLAEQLRRWMINQEEEKLKKERKQQKKKKDYPPQRRFDAGSLNGHTHFTAKGELHRPTVTENSYPVQVFAGSNDPRQQLFSAIPRRNDTFYVLSFSTDYFLVPATAHNKTMRPRMSLLMPVITPLMNDTTRETLDSIGMMQIDCEILSTNIISVHRSASPENAHYNSTPYARSGGSDKSKDHRHINIHSRKGENNTK